MNHRAYAPYILSHEEREEKITLLSGILDGCTEIIFAYLYGSFPEGLPFHDLDLGVFVSGIREADSLFYMLNLAQNLSSKLRIPIDVRVLNFAPVTFSYYVIRGNLIVDKDEEVRLRFVERVIQQYLDLKPRIRMAIKEAFGSWT